MPKGRYRKKLTNGRGNSDVAVAGGGKIALTRRAMTNVGQYAFVKRGRKRSR